jgi:hypothetical protein
MEASGHTIIRHLKSSSKVINPSGESRGSLGDGSSSTTG